jgi:transposase
VASIADRLGPDKVIVGVDTHSQVHVAVAITGLGARLGELSFDPSPAGFARLEEWSAMCGEVTAWGVEGTGSYGAGLARYLMRSGECVLEVNRPDRSLRRRVGKSDPIDAEAAARSVLAGTATTAPKTGDGLVESMRVTRIVKRSAVKARTQAINQLKALIVTAPPDTLRADLTGLTPVRLVTRCASLRPNDTLDPVSVTKRAIRVLARRIQALTAEIKQLQAELDALVAAVAPDLLEVFAVGPDTAAALLITAGDNPHRLHSEAAFAALCGTSPIPASSGKTDRHRLNRGGDRQANAALHRIVIVRLSKHPETQTYMADHMSAEGGNKKHVIRKLKRYLARQLYPLIVDAVTTTPAQHAA